MSADIEIHNLTYVPGADTSAAVPLVCERCGSPNMVAKEAFKPGALPHSSAEPIPPELYDGMAVYVALGVEKTRDIKPHMVADVLDAVVRLIRKRQRAER